MSASMRAMAVLAKDHTKRFQWEANSAPSQAFNCGPTCATQVAGYYREAYYGIEATRRLVTGAGTPTNSSQQRDMLVKRGVPATSQRITSIAALHSLVDSGRRPVIIGVRMSRVPANVRDHTFLGMHALVILTGATLNGVRGFWVTDPNFSPPGGARPDPDRGMKWYSDSVLQYAWINDTTNPKYCVVPNAAKPLPATLKGRGHVKTPTGTNRINIRRSASLSATIYATARSDGKTYRVSDGKMLWSNDSLYIITSLTADWVNVRTGSGLNLSISRPLFVITTYP